MKRSIFLAFFLIAFLNIYSQGIWSSKANFGGSARHGAVGFAIGNKGYIGTGIGGSGNMNDYWEWDQATNVWTQKASLPGLPRFGAVGFSIGLKGYIGTGCTGGTNYLNDFWEWDQVSNTWVQKAPLAGSLRYRAVGFSIGNKGYIGFGCSSPSYGMDPWLFEWNPSTNVWTQKGSFSNSGRWAPFGFSIGTKGYVGTGHNYQTGGNDYLWEFDQSTSTWTQKANFSGGPRASSSSFAIGNFGYVGLGTTGFWNGSGTVSDFYRYDPSTNSWTTMPNFGGGLREDAVSFSIGCYGYIGTGWVNESSATIKKDFWEFYDSTNATCCKAPANMGGTGTICQGDTATLIAAYGGSNYLWNTGATTSIILVTPSTTTTYTVIETYGMCADTAIGTVATTLAPVPIIAGNNSICSGFASTLSASGGNTYSWSNGSITSSITVAPTATTTYSISISIGSCSVDTSITVSVDLSPTATITGNDTLCLGNLTTLVASGGGSYSWSNGTTNATIIVSPTITNGYTVLVTSPNGCTDSDTATVHIIPYPIASISGNDTTCQGNTEIFIAAGGTNYLWNTSATSNSISISSAGIYSVVVSNWICKDTATSTLVVNPNPVASAGADVSISFGDSTALIGSGGGYYLWNTGDTSNTIVVSPTITTTYTLIVIGANGCTDTSIVTVFVKEQECSVYIPNAFSPNNDERDDVFFLFGKCIEEMKFIVFDRWGENVFETNDPKSGWDGTYKGKQENSGVFMYFFEAKMTNGEKVTKKGNITLMR